MINRLAKMNVKVINSEGCIIFIGTLDDFVEGFVYDEVYFYHQLRFKGLKTFPNVPIEYNNNTHVVQFQ